MVKKPISSQTANKNELSFNGGKINKIPNIKIKLYDSTNTPVNNYTELKKHNEKNKIDIILTFNVRNVEEEFEEGEFPVATYSLLNRDSKERYLENKKQALIRNLFEEKLSDGDEKIEFREKEKNLNNLDNIECLITKAPSDPNNDSILRLDIKITANGQPYVIRDENTRLFGYFNLPKKIEYDELITFPSPPKAPEPFWTFGKIISACVVIGIIAVLIFFYRKKIWSWIKREDKTKQKEQVEIF